MMNTFLKIYTLKIITFYSANFFLGSYAISTYGLFSPYFDIHDVYIYKGIVSNIWNDTFEFKPLHYIINSSTQTSFTNYSYNLGVAYNTKLISLNFNNPVILLLLGILYSLVLLFQNCLHSIISFIISVYNFVRSHASAKSTNKNTSIVSEKPSGVKKRSGSGNTGKNHKGNINKGTGGGGKKNPNINKAIKKAIRPIILRSILRELYLLRALLTYIIVNENSMSLEAQQALLGINFQTRLPNLHRYTQPNSILGMFSTDFAIFFHDLSLITLGQVEYFHHFTLSSVLGFVENLLQPLDSNYESSDENIDDINEVFQHFGLDTSLFDI